VGGPDGVGGPRRSGGVSGVPFPSVVSSYALCAHYSTRPPSTSGECRLCGAMRALFAIVAPRRADAVIAAGRRQLPSQPSLAKTRPSVTKDARAPVIHAARTYGAAMTPRCLVLGLSLLLAPAANAAAAERWQRPVGGSVLRAFSLAADHFAPGQHRGVDLGAPLGAAVRAACGGRVTFAGRVPRGGRTVSVRCGRLIATYQHLGALIVRRGQTLAPGSPIGSVGRSGAPRSHRSHLHLGAREAVTGRYVDPLTLIGDAPRTMPPLPLARRGARRPLPLGPAPSRPLARPAPRRVPASAPARPAPAGVPTPVAVWVGLLCVGLGLPLGGLITWRRTHAATPAPPAPRRLTTARR